MNEPHSPPEERIEEIRAIRQGLMAELGGDLRAIREFGNRCPEGFRFLTGVQPMTPLALQISRRRPDESA